MFMNQQDLELKIIEIKTRLKTNSRFLEPQAYRKLYLEYLDLCQRRDTLEQTTNIPQKELLNEGKVEESSKKYSKGLSGSGPIRHNKPSKRYLDRIKKSYQKERAKNYDNWEADGVDKHYRESKVPNVKPRYRADDLYESDLTENTARDQLNKLKGKTPPARTKKNQYLAKLVKKRFRANKKMEKYSKERNYDAYGKAAVAKRSADYRLKNSNTSKYKRIHVKEAKTNQEIVKSMSKGPDERRLETRINRLKLAQSIRTARQKNRRYKTPGPYDPGYDINKTKALSISKEDRSFSNDRFQESRERHLKLLKTYTDPNFSNLPLKKQLQVRRLLKKSKIQGHGPKINETWNKLPKNFTPKKAKLDQYDTEAEKEGNAVSKMKKDYGSDNPLIGRRMQKIIKGHTRGGAIVAAKRVDNFTKDHKAAQNKYMHKEAREPGETYSSLGNRWNKAHSALGKEKNPHKKAKLASLLNKIQSRQSIAKGKLYGQSRVASVNNNILGEADYQKLLALLSAAKKPAHKKAILRQLQSASSGSKQWTVDQRQKYLVGLLGAKNMHGA